jgi:hypothetical protein
MKPAYYNRQRFHKPWHFLQLAAEVPMEALAELFHNFSLDNFRKELSLWKTNALSNQQSVYEDIASRKDLEDFMQELLKLIEAFYLLNKEKNKSYYDLLFTALPKETREKIESNNKIILLSEEEQSNPSNTIKQFNQLFSETYTQIELMDLLEAIITYEGDLPTDKSTLILYYQQLLFLIKQAFTLAHSYIPPRLS